MKILSRLLSMLLLTGFSGTKLEAQLLSGKQTFTHDDTLRGSDNANRSWWDVTRYDIQVQPDYDTKTIVGVTTIGFLGAPSSGATRHMQIDLQEPLMIDSALLDGTRCNAEKQSKNTWLIPVPAGGKGSKKGGDKKASLASQLVVYYHGKPREAVRPPWDGGWIWKKDQQGRPWMSVACQGTGASVWYPCKDIQSDEPDNGASLSIIVPDSLVAVANGRLISRHSQGNLSTTTWEVRNPINNYNIIPYIGKYVHFGEIFNGEKGKLDCDYWVLDYNQEKAKEHFRQVPLMLKAFEYWYGPYPFYEDSYKLVESPHLGMEHQSAVAYGNGYQNGYLGRDRSSTGEGMKWDYIIVHESGHEWFANNVTTKDIADMWVHEGFTCYSETLFTDYWYGKDAGNRYLQGLRRGIQNKSTIIGPYGVNQEGSGDMYNKGANMLHTIRQLVNNDTTFRGLLRGLNKTFYHQTVTSAQVEQYMSQQSGIDLSKVFDQYLRTTQVPQLVWKMDNGSLLVKWTNCVQGFQMTERFSDAKGIQHTVMPNDKDWTSAGNMELPADESLIWDKNFYVQVAKGN